MELYRFNDMVAWSQITFFPSAETYFAYNIIIIIMQFYVQMVLLI